MPRRFERLFSLVLGLLALGGAAVAQVPVDAASDRRVGDYVFFKTFGEPKLPFDDLEDVSAVRAKSDDYFRSELATCEIEKPTCNPDTVYELADRFCEALEFHEAATWRVSKDDDELTLHWVVCGLKK
ncbi:MAG: hypothetical protein AAFR75_09450 [Pseudomonadota bacterium]